MIVHLCFPLLDGMDQSRRKILSENKSKLHFVGDKPNPQLVNFCHHRLAECTCLAHYGPVYPIAVHSLYYLTERDFDALREHGTAVGETPPIWAAIHKPDDGVSVPLGKPEFTWTTPEAVPSAFSWPEHLRHVARRFLLRDGLIKFIPLNSAGTLYTHSRLDWLADGGKHVSFVTRALEDLCENVQRLIVLSAVIRVLAVLLVLGVLNSIMVLWDYYSIHMYYASGWRLYLPQMVRDLAVHYALSRAGFSPIVVLLPVSLALFLSVVMLVLWYFVVPEAEPGVFTDYTLQVIHKTSVGDADSNPLVSILEIRILEPTSLVRQVFDSVTVQPEGLSAAIVSLLLTDLTPKNLNRTTAGIMRRFGYPVTPAVRHTNLAKQEIERLNYRSYQAGPPPWWSLVQAPWLCLRFAFNLIQLAFRRCVGLCAWWVKHPAAVVWLALTVGLACMGLHLVAPGSWPIAWVMS